MRSNNEWGPADQLAVCYMISGLSLAAFMAVGWLSQNFGLALLAGIVALVGTSILFFRMDRPND